MALLWGSKDGEGLEGGQTIAISCWVGSCQGEICPTLGRQPCPFDFYGRIGDSILRMRRERYRTALSWMSRAGYGHSLVIRG